MLVQNPRDVWKTLRNYKPKYEGNIENRKRYKAKSGFDIHVEISHIFSNQI